MSEKDQRGVKCSKKTRHLLFKEGADLIFYWNFQLSLIKRNDA